MRRKGEKDEDGKKKKGESRVRPRKKIYRDYGSQFPLSKRSPGWHGRACPRDQRIAMVPNGMHKDKSNDQRGREGLDGKPHGP